MSWTRHGHYIPGTTMSDGDRPPICRCGGVGLCKACNMDAALHWGRENNTPPTEKITEPIPEQVPEPVPEHVDYWESFAEQVRESLNIIASLQVEQVNILEELFEMIKKSQNTDEIKIEPNPVHMEQVSYSFEDFANFLKKE